MNMDTVKISDMAYHNEKARLVFVRGISGNVPAIVLKTIVSGHWTRTLVYSSYEISQRGWTN